ncbi:uncharacterized protein K02A2.6-like [Topomyia yanbarensis]|uniref:uncharacterized protein K02A2.6-like n=1 Tax=Topomyia yanbarensis TaxID=2498891 RepID=UPI00273BA596|nr:uncharacterized protein K02A2.6-like [Topomyia yanbarensis]
MSQERNVPAAATAAPNFAIDPFDREKTKFARWIKRLEGAFRMFNVAEERWKDYLLFYMGSTTYDLLCDHITPTEPENSTYQELVTILNAFFDPEPLEMVEIWKFRARKQNDGETMAQFITELQREAKFCKFGEYLTKELRNQLVFGLRSKRIRSRLIEEKNLTYEKAKDIAISMEASGEGAEALEKKLHEVNFTERKSNRRNYSTKYCYRCGSETHLASVCKYKEAVCSFCKKTGHLKRVCLSFTKQNKDVGEEKIDRFVKTKKKLHTNMLEEESDEAEPEEISDVSGSDEMDLEDVCVLDICKLDDKSKTLSKIMLPLTVNKKVIKFEVDCGSPVSLISLADKMTYFNDLPLTKTNVELISYCENKIKVHGYMKAEVHYKGHSNMLRLFVVDTKRHALLGREWMRELQVDWDQIIRNANTVSSIAVRTQVSDAVSRLLKQFPAVFDNSVGTIRNIRASLTLKANSKPIFLKARTLPFSIRDTVEREIEKMVSSGILVKVKHSSWATPVVPVMKSHDRVRLCGDYKVTVNTCLVVDEHPLPTIDELFANMAGGQKFSKIDLAQAYLQMEVCEEDREILTLNTHLGLYQPTRLMYGVSSAPAIFQREISQILRDIPSVSVFLDDIKITGPDDQSHLQRLGMVLRRLNEYGMRVNVAKCEFFVDQIEYCGFVIDKEGIRKMKKKIDAIQEMPRPRNREQVRAFVGLINYYGRFLKNLSSNIYPIINLLKDNVVFEWNIECEKAFRWVKREIQSDRVLAHYDPKLPLVLATDASPYGVGAVLSHVYRDGMERPIQYASQTLNKSQQNYTQVDKEAYSIIFGVKKFYQYLYGRKFTLLTDNKPVSQILSPNKGLPMLSALRMQHYAVFLGSFDYEIRYRCSKENANADGMSRLPIENPTNNNCIEEVDVIELNQIEALPVTVEELADCTKHDPNVRNLLQGMKVGRIVDGRDRFGIDQSEFSVQKNCILKGIRVYIPPKLRRRVLEELHIGHFGVSRMKSLARSYCWWECIDRDIEEMSRNCSNCATTRKNPTKVPIHCWERPSQPFQRLHIDFAGPFLGLNFLVIVDAYTKWPEVKIIPDLTTGTTIDRLQEYFATYGVPTVIVSDRGVQFTSVQFQVFLKKNNVVHKMGAPYHPATNGQAERFVQTFKDKLKALKCERKDVQLELYKILMAYRRTIHPTTGESPSMLVFGRQLKSRLDLIIPSDTNTNSNRERNIAVRDFGVDDRVSARDFLSSSKWQFGTVMERVGKLHYIVKLDDGRIWKRHVDQLQPGPVKEASDKEALIDANEVYCSSRARNMLLPPPIQLPPEQGYNNQGSYQQTRSTDDQTKMPTHFQTSTDHFVELSRENKSEQANEASFRSTDISRRSTRIRKPPNRLDL